MYTNKLRGARIAAAVLLATLGGCQTLKADHDANSTASGILLGRLIAPNDVSGPFVVEVTDREQDSVRQRVFVEQAGAFSVRVPSGSYKFVAFADRNRDGVRDSSEAVSVRMVLNNRVHAGEVMALPSMDIRAR